MKLKTLQYFFIIATLFLLQRGFSAYAMFQDQEATLETTSSTSTNNPKTQSSNKEESEDSSKTSQSHELKKTRNAASANQAKENTDFIESIIRGMQIEKKSVFSKAHWESFQSLIGDKLDKSNAHEEAEHLFKSSLLQNKVKGYGGAEVTLFKKGELTEKVLKTFEKNKEAGKKEYIHSVYAYAFVFKELQNKVSLSKLGMVKPLVGGFSKENFVILYEGAKGKEIYTLLEDMYDSYIRSLSSKQKSAFSKTLFYQTRDKPKGMLQAIARTLQSFHKATYDRFYKESFDRESIFRTYKEAHSQKGGITNFFSPEESNFKELRLIVHKHKKYEEKDDHPMFKEIKDLLKKKHEEFEEKNNQLHSEETRPCLIHGDAHGKNLFLSDDESLTLIDYETMVTRPPHNEAKEREARSFFPLGDPAQDVGRFMGSLWTYAVSSEQYTQLSDGQYPQLILLTQEWERFFLEEYGKAWGEEWKDTFKERIQENVKHFRNKFLLIVLTHKENSPLYKKSLFNIICNHLLPSESRYEIKLPSLTKGDRKVPPMQNKERMEIQVLNKMDVLFEEAEIATLDIFYPLINRLSEGFIKNSLKEAQGELKSLLRGKKDLLSSIIKKLEAIKEEIPKNIALSGSTLEQFAIFLSQMKQRQNSLESIYEKPDFNRSIQERLLSENKNDIFYKSIIGLRNGIRMDVLRDLFENKEHGECKNCQKKWLWPEKVGGLPIMECAFCGHIES